MLGFPSTFKETKTETGVVCTRLVGWRPWRQNGAGLGTGLSAAEKQGAGSKLTDSLRMGAGVG